MVFYFIADGVHCPLFSSISTYIEMYRLFLLSFFFIVLLLLQIRCVHHVNKSNRFVIVWQLYNKINRLSDNISLYQVVLQMRYSHVSCHNWHIETQFSVSISLSLFQFASLQSALHFYHYLGIYMITSSII